MKVKGEEMCEGCRDVYLEVQRIEDKFLNFHMSYVSKVAEYESDRTYFNSKLDALHKRMDTVGEALISHMKDEEENMRSITDSLSSIGAKLEGVATKEDLANTNGRVKTIWVIGAFVLTLIVGVSSFFIVEGFNHSLEKSSKANYHGLKKVIEKEVKDGK